MASHRRWCGRDKASADRNVTDRQDLGLLSPVYRGARQKCNKIDRAFRPRRHVLQDARLATVRGTLALPFPRGLV